MESSQIQDQSQDQMIQVERHRINKSSILEEQTAEEDQIPMEIRIEPNRTRLSQNIPGTYDTDKTETDQGGAVRQISSNTGISGQEQQQVAPIFSLLDLEQSPLDSGKRRVKFNQVNDATVIQRKIQAVLRSRISSFSSRRLSVKYDDDQSQDSNGEEEAARGAELSRVNTQGNFEILKPHPSFKNYSNEFQNLIKAKNIPTMFNIVQMLITYDSKSAVTVTRKSDRAYWIKMYCLETAELTFEEKFGGQQSDYIKLKDVEQSLSGARFGVVYNNDGVFYLRTFGRTTRSEADILADEVDLNALAGLDDHTMCVDSFPDPFAVCSFITDELLFVCVFHTPTLTHCHFLWDSRSRKVVGEVCKRTVGTSQRNFPYKSFYNDEMHEVYVFYRQGQAFIIKANNISDYQYDQMTDFDLGMMYLVYNNALVARSSSDILFFKIMVDEDTGYRSWKQYDQLDDMRGLIYYIRGNKRIQITTDKKIWFYLICKKTFRPLLENVMNNYMACNQMMFGPKVKYCVTFKTNQRSFDVYRRKYNHDFRVPIYTDIMENSFGLEIKSMNKFLVSKVDKILVHDCETLKVVDEVPISLLKTETREPNQVIAMQICQDDEYLVVISGKILIMNEQSTNQLFIFKRNLENFEFDSKISLLDLPEFQRVCMKFQFKLTEKKIKDTLLFVKTDQIFEMNFRATDPSQMFRTVYKFHRQLVRQPLFFQPNAKQDIFIIASPEEVVYVSPKSQVEAFREYYDIDTVFNLQFIEAVCYDKEDTSFYLVCNMVEEKLGFYVLKIDEENPTPKDENFLIKWSNNLNIANVSLNIFRSSVEDSFGNIVEHKELIVSCKRIFVNVYDVIVMDISVDYDDPHLLFRHESDQLWESECSGFLLSKTKVFVSLNIRGMQVLSLGSKDKVPIKDSKGGKWILHSLEGVSFLKVDPGNYILFQCSQQDESTISIVQEYEKQVFAHGKKTFQTNFTTLFNVKIVKATLRELLLFNSLYVSKTLSDVNDIVNDQPDPRIFYKSFLELNCGNMTSLLSFDSRSTKFLLSPDFDQYFDKKFPIFYKIKIQKGQSKDMKFFYRNAIDGALRSNQFSAIEAILQYIVKYQNNYISSFLFNKNLPQLIENSQSLNISLIQLFDSQVFQYTFDFDEWPTSHQNDTDCSRYFNESIFQLRKYYSKVFPEKEFRSMEELAGQEKEDDSNDKETSQKVYKIKYTVNLLPMVGQYYHKYHNPYNGKQTKFIENADINLLEILCAHCDSEECIDIFKTETVVDMMEFKWNNFAFSFHAFGLMYHLAYIVILFGYTFVVYIHPSFGEEDHKEEDDPENYGWKQPVAHKEYILCLLIGITYPFLYELNQLYKSGVKDYFGDLGNQIDMLYLLASVIMAILHSIPEVGAYAVPSKILMLLVITLAIRRTFNYLRIFDALSPIVSMINQVLSDIQTFMLFYFILVFLFSLMIGVLGVANTNYKGSMFTQANYKLINTEHPDWFIAKDGQVTFPNGTTAIIDNWEHWQIEYKENDHGKPVTIEGADVPGLEYKYLNLMISNLITTIRVSIGDYELRGAAKLGYADNIIFWFIWSVQVLLTFIIFLNIIVAEVTNSYMIVSEKLEAVIKNQKAELTAEAEEGLPGCKKSENNFPKYIVQRKVEQ